MPASQPFKIQYRTITNTNTQTQTQLQMWFAQMPASQPFTIQYRAITKTNTNTQTQIQMEFAQMPASQPFTIQYRTIVLKSPSDCNAETKTKTFCVWCQLWFMIKVGEFQLNNAGWEFPHTPPCGCIAFFPHLAAPSLQPLAKLHFTCSCKVPLEHRYSSGSLLILLISSFLVLVVSKQCTMGPLQWEDGNRNF